MTRFVRAFGNLLSSQNNSRCKSQNWEVLSQTANIAKSLEDMHKVGNIMESLMNPKPSSSDIGDLVNIDDFDIDLLLNDL